MSGKVVHLLRHGPPARTGLLLGHCDEPPCDPTGGLRGAVPAALTIRRLVTSDLRRALVGAEVLAADRGVDLTVDRRWRELNFGAWDGLAPQSLPRDALARFWDDPETCPPPQGERWSSLRQRVGSALTELDDATLVVTHGGAMRAAVSITTGLDHRQVWALDLPYGALLSLRIWTGDSLAGQIIGLGSGVLS
ncbi:histidine phosphatase family protein [Novosphingobium sp. KCTC 2891]|uniref:histidine phosphatase family protein n=1 Tax=Novosphingobium sp. KCTC 2891 TaxID=2989730 RepID=UPI002223E238|nr:histidine phosphatase family protein [Novosphingobium sp. KCTC 2891]MCW1383725.1 histidine phosphatase family protein [Novosphingobium sp. KCTC 2891]